MKKNKHKKVQNDTINWLGEKGTVAYVFIMLVVFPFFYTNKQFNLHIDKMYFFLVISLVYISAIFPVLIKDVQRWWNTMELKVFRKADVIFVLILLMALVLSEIYALDIWRSFFQMEDRTISGVCVLFCIMVYFLIRKYGVFNRKILSGWLAGTYLMYLCGILCGCGINFLYLQDGLRLDQKAIYLTPLGNTNFNTSFVCLMLPMMLIMYMLEEEKHWEIAYGINIYMGFLFMFLIRTDTSFIALLAGIVILGYFALEKQKWFDKYFQILGIYLGVKITLAILFILLNGPVYLFSNWTLELFDWKVLVGECAAFFLLLFLQKKDILRRKVYAIRKLLLGTCIVGMVCVTACIVYANVRGTAIAKESFLSHLILTESTFSYRGFIWKATIRRLETAPFFRLLIGNGLNCYKLFMGNTCILDTTIYADPHNEFLQMLVDMGILGVIGYFGLLFTTLINALRKWRDNLLQVGIVVTVTVYMIQGLADEYAIFYFPLLFIFLGLANGNILEKNK